MPLLSKCSLETVSLKSSTILPSKELNLIIKKSIGKHLRNKRIISSTILWKKKKKKACRTNLALLQTRMTELVRIGIIYLDLNRITEGMEIMTPEKYNLA